MRMTLDEYDVLLDRFDNINSPTYWPTPKEFELMEKEPDKYIVYICYLDSRCEIPKNNEQKYSKKNMCDFIKQYLSFE